MKKNLRRSILLVLCLSVLSGSVGMALPDRFCRMLGISVGQVASRLMPEACCDSPMAEAPADEDDCCEEDVTHQKLEPVSGLQFPTFGFASLSPAVLPSWEPSLFLQDRHTQEILQYADSSPPLYGRDLLCAFHLLLI